MKRILYVFLIGNFWSPVANARGQYGSVVVNGELSMFQSIHGVDYTAGKQLSKLTLFSAQQDSGSVDLLHLVLDDKNLLELESKMPMEEPTLDDTLSCIFNDGKILDKFTDEHGSLSGRFAIERDTVREEEHMLGEIIRYLKDKTSVTGPRNIQVRAKSLIHRYAAQDNKEDKFFVQWVQIAYVYSILVELNGKKQSIKPSLSHEEALNAYRVSCQELVKNIEQDVFASYAKKAFPLSVHLYLYLAHEYFSSSRGFSEKAHRKNFFALFNEFGLASLITSCGAISDLFTKLGNGIGSDKPRGYEELYEDIKNRTQMLFKENMMIVGLQLLSDNAFDSVINGGAVMARIIAQQNRDEFESSIGVYAGPELASFILKNTKASEPIMNSSQRARIARIDTHPLSKEEEYIPAYQLRHLEKSRLRGKEILALSSLIEWTYQEFVKGHDKCLSMYEIDPLFSLSGKSLEENLDHFEWLLGITSRKVRDIVDPSSNILDGIDDISALVQLFGGHRVAQANNMSAQRIFTNTIAIALRGTKNILSHCGALAVSLIDSMSPVRRKSYAASEVGSDDSTDVSYHDDSKSDEEDEECTSKLVLQRLDSQDSQLELQGLTPAHEGDVDSTTASLETHTGAQAASTPSKRRIITALSRGVGAVVSTPVMLVKYFSPSRSDLGN